MMGLLMRRSVLFYPLCSTAQKGSRRRLCTIQRFYSQLVNSMLTLFLNLGLNVFLFSFITFLLGFGETWGDVVKRRETKG
jgi:hypothetical protein